MRKSISHLSRAFICAVALSTVAYGIPFGPITIAEAASNYSTVLLQDSPAAYWRFGEAAGSTTAADASGHNFPLTYQGSVALGQAGAVVGDANTAAQFNGTNRYASRATAPLTTTTNWSLEAWIYPTTLPQLGAAIYNGIDDSTHGGYGFEIASGTGTSGSNIIGILGSAGVVNSGYTLPAANRWYHVAMTRDTTTIRFYVNGQQTATTSTTAPPAPGADASVGGGLTATGSLVAAFMGLVDEPAMYPSALSQGRIVAHYQEGANVQTAFGKWIQQTPATVPAARSDASISYDAARNNVVMFGGKNASGTALNETWIYDGTNWTKLTPATSPPIRYGASFAYSAASSTAILFGGYNGTSWLNDTWSWNGTTWSQLSPATSPTVRAYASAAYSSASATIVLFGGQKTKTAVAADTWTWNGTTWSQKSPVHSPSARYLASAAYDNATSNVVLFGGYTGSAYIGDTWSWNGTDWTQSTGSPSPSIRRAEVLLFDVATNQLTLFGGYNGTSYLNDTWAWDGSTWSAQLSTTSPPIRADAAAVYQSPIGWIVLYGGTTASALSDTWTWNTPPSAPLNVQASAGNAQATVMWSTPSSTGGAAISSYKVTPYAGSTAGSPTTVTGTSTPITGLSNGTTYTFQVVAVNSIGNGPGANSNSVTPATVPGAPSPATGTAGDMQATVNWTVPSDGGSAIMNYTVTPYIGSTGGTPVNVTAPAISKIVTGLINGTVYTFQVTATNSVGTGAVATTGQVKPGRVPGAPTGVTASAGDTTATVNWTAPSYDGGYAITGYTVTSSPGGLIGSSSGSQTTATVTGLTDGTPYTFTVTATNSIGTGPSSSPSTPVTPIGRPGAPTGVTAAPGNANALVTWNAPAANGSPITSYTVTPYISGTAQSPTAVNGSPPATSVTITNLTNGTPYTFQVTATNSVGTGSAGSTVGSVTPATIPTPPTSVSASTGNATATVTWQLPASNGGSAITGYTVTPYVAGTPGTAQSVNASTFTATFNGLSNGTSYIFKVVATNALGNSDPASSNAVTPATTPGAPTGVQATAGNAQANVSWGTPTADGGAAITLYTVTPYIGSTAQTSVTVNAPATSKLITGLTNGTDYTFQVTATNSAGTGPAGVSTAVTPMTVPDAPASVTATAGNATATVTWSAVPLSGNGGSAISGYTVTPYVAGVAGTPQTVNASTLTATFNGLSNGTTYIFKVVATNAVGDSAPTSSNAVTPAAPPSQPQTVTASTGNTQATVNWVAPASNGGANIINYTVTPYIGTTAQPGWTVNPTPTTFVATGLTNGTTYTFQVAAINSAGTSPVGTSNAVTPATTPSAPQNVSAATGDHQATVTWNLPASDGGSLITSFTITPYIGNTAGVPVTGDASTSKVMTGLTNGTTYTFRVYASNSIGPGPTASSNAIVVGLPAAPTGVAATGSANQATVSWTSSVTNGATITSYVVQAYVGSQKQNASATGGATSVVIAGLPAGVTYTFQVYAQSNYGDSPLSSMSNAVTPSGAATTYASTVRADGAGIYYRLGEPSGPVAADSSGNANLGAYTFAPILGQPGALLGDPDTSVHVYIGGFVPSADGVIRLPSSAQLPTANSARTLEAWFQASQSGTVLSYGTNATRMAFQVHVDSSAVTVVTNGDNKVFNTQYAITNGGWHHLATTYDGTSLIAYLDGQSLGTRTFGAALNTVVDSNGLVLGNQFWSYWTADEQLVGNLDEVAIYPTALTAAQIAAHFSAGGNTRPTAPVVSASAGANQATISWTASTASAGAPVTQYVVQAFNAAQAVNAVGVNGTTISTTVTGLQAGVAYTFQVTALNDFGFSPTGTSTAVTPSGSATTYASTVIGDQPAFYYRLGEPNGPAAADSSGLSRTADYLYTPTHGVTGALIGDGDPGLSVTYTPNFIPSAGGVIRYRWGTAGLPAGNAARSVEAWFKTTSTRSGGILGYGTYSTRMAFQVQMRGDNQLALVTNGDDKVFTTPYSIANGGWHQLILTYDGTTATMYLDGQSLGGQTFGGALNTAADANGLIIASDFWNSGGGVGDQFDGSLDEVALYPAALTAAQVSTHFAASGNAAPAAPTVSAATGTNQATVNWTVPATSPGAPVLGYTVTAYNGTQPQNAIAVNGATTSAILSGLRQGVTYTFQVAAFNNFGSGPAGVSSATPITSGTPNTYASAIFADTPGLYYRLSDPSGAVAADSSGHGRTADYLYAPSFGAAGALLGDSDPGITVAYGNQFIPGAGGVVRYHAGTGGLPTGNAPRTVELWLKTTMPNSLLNGLVGYGSNATRQAFQVQTTGDNQLTLFVNGDNKAFTTPYRINNGGWHQVVVTYDGTTATLYLDGQSLGGQSFGAALNTAVDANGLILANDFWTYGSGVDYQFNGSLDDVALYPAALTASQVAAHFSASGNARPGTPTNVTATGAANQATVTWTGVPGNGSTTSSYMVTAFSGSQPQYQRTVDGTQTSAILTGLPAGTAFTFQVTATNNFGTSPPGVSAAITPTGASSTYPSTVMGDGPAFYYRLDEAAGSTVADSSGSGRNAEYLYNPSFGQPGVVIGDGDTGVALTYNGAFVPGAGGVMHYRWNTAGLPVGNTARSIEVWFNTTSNNGGGLVGYGTNATRQAFQLQIRGDNQVAVVTSGDDKVFNTPYAVDNGGWHQVIVSYDGTAATMYLDGRSLGGQTFGAPLGTAIDGNGLIIANDFWTYGSGVNYQFSGSLDEVSLYPSALSATQVQAHFSASGNAPPTAPTITSVQASPNGATINWTASQAPTGSPVTGYRVIASAGGASRNAIAVSGGTTSTTLSGLAGTTSYSFQVVATNTFGDGPPSATSSALAPGGPTSTYASTVIGDNPTVYYRLGDPSGAAAADSSGHGNTGTFSGWPYTLGAPGGVANDSDTATGFASGCCYFGQPIPGGFMRVRPVTGLPLGNASRSIEAWIKTTANATQAVAGYGLSGSTRQAFELRIVGTNQVQIVTGSDDHAITTPASVVLNDGNWHQVAVSYDGSVLLAYVDGVSVGSTGFSGSLNTALDNNGIVLANDFGNVGGSQYNGSIDEVSVYGTALGPTQISSHYQAAGYNFGTPGAPTAVTATGGANQASVSWTAPVNTGTSAISGYLIMPHVGGTIRTPTKVAGTQTSATIGNLSGATSYTFTVVASNDSGNGPASATSNAVTVTGASYPYSSTILGDGPAAYWRLGENPGVPATDSAGNGNNGSYTGGFTEGQAGPIVGDPNTAVLFDGMSGHVSVPSSASLDIINGLSIEAWVNFTTAGTTQLLVNKGDGATPNASAYELGFVPATGFVFDTFSGGTMTRAASSTGVTPGQWYHLVGTRTVNGTLLLYVNGRVLGAANDGGGGLNNINAPLGLAGSGLGTGNNLQPFNGTLGEIAVYPATLSGAQVSNHWQLGGYRAGTPIGVTASGGANQATISWTAPSGGPAITGYIVTPQLGTTQRTPTYATASATSVTVSNLSGGASYTFIVSAMNAYGFGVASAASTAVNVTGTSYPYAATVLANTPGGYWRLGEISGSLAIDASGHGNAGAYSGAVTLGQSGAIQADPDASAGLDGTTGRAIVPSSPTLSITGALSLEAWVKLNSVASTQLLINKGDGATAPQSAYQLAYVVGQGFAFSTFIGNVTSFAGQSATPATAGTWYHVVGTRTAAGALTLYVNGNSVATGTDIGSALNVVDSPVGIGAAGSGTGSSLQPLNGSIDEAAVYPSALPLAQVATNWDSGGYVPSAPTNVVATSVANYQATVSWSVPTASGTSAITGYSITAQTGSLEDSPISVDGASTSVNIPNLSGGSSYTFAVAATNASGTGAVGTSNAVMVLAPPNPGLGQHLQILCQNTSLPFGGFSLTSGPITLGSQWTIEGWMWGFNSNADTGGNSAWGLLGEGRAQVAGGRTVIAPSVGFPNAGIEMRTGSSPLGSLFVWPGGSYTIPSSGYGFPDAPTPTHYALDYDGTTVRGFINGSLWFSQPSSTAGGIYGWPGIADQQEMGTASFDEFRISSVARYTTSFTPQTTNFPDGQANTTILWHFDDHPIGQTYADLVYVTTNFDWSHAVDALNIPATLFRDSSGNDNAAVLYTWGSGQITGGFPMIYYVFTLAQGQSVDPSEVRSPSEPQQTACESGSYPVNCSTGEFWHTFADLSIPGRGVPLSLSRTYSSLHASSNGPMGYGWTDNYNMFLSFDGSGNATVHEENWAAVAFPSNGSGGYQPSSHVFATLVRNGDGTYTFSRKDQVHYVFDSGGRLIRETDRNGYATVLAYNGSGQLSTVTDPENRALTFSYNPNGSLALVLDSASRTVSFLYDANGNLSQATDVGNGLSKFTYDSNHFMLTFKDPNCSAASTCNGVINVFDGGGRVTSQTDPMGEQSTYSYLGTTTVIHDPKGHETDERYINGLLMTRSLGVGSSQQATWTYAYDPGSLAPIAIRDPKGHSMAMKYDGSGNMTATIDPLGRATRFTYNSFNDPLTVTDPLSVTATYNYDANGNLRGTSRPLVGPGQNSTTSLIYDPANPGDVSTMTDANSKVWHFTHDQYGDTASSTDPLGNTRTSFYDGIGRLTSVVSPKGNAAGGNPATYLTAFGYDSFGDLTSVLDPLNHTLNYTFDRDRNLTRVVDSNNNPTSYTYDSNNRLTQVTRADNSTIKNTYDGDGNLTQVQDGLSNPTSYGYDALDRMTSITDALNRTTSYAYDALGNRTSLVDPMNRTTTYSHDVASELTGIKYSDGTTPNVVISYDGGGHRETMSDGTGTTRYSYDSLDRLIQSINGGNQTLSYGYDLKSQLTSITYPGGSNVVTRAYDDAGRLHSVSDWLSHTTTYAYDPNSNLTTQTYPNGTAATSSYDAADRLTGTSDSLGTNQPFLSLAYARDAAGQLASENSQSYGSDILNRLTSAAPTGYAYDAADRMTQIAVTGGNTTNFVYDVANQVQSVTTLNSGSSQLQRYTYGFDANGNRTSRTDQANATTNYVYDQADRLKAIGPSYTYAYDAAGIRQTKIANGVPEGFTWDVGDPLPLIIQDGSTSYVTGRGGLPLEQISSSGTVLYYHQDQLGSTRALTDSGGIVVATYTYDAYGNLTSVPTAISNPFQFAGEYFDQESSLIYLRGRFYEPATASFLSRDPKGKIQTYAYAANSPLNAIDPGGADPGDTLMQAGAHSKQWLTDYPLLNFVPVVGATLNGFAAYRDAQCGNYFDAIAEGAMAIPLLGMLGDAVKGGEVAAKGAAQLAGPGGMLRLTFEASPKHPGLLGEAGQAALDTSVQVSKNSARRVGVDYGQGRYVVFDETYPGRGIFHGHYRDWNQLTQTMQSVLRDIGLASGRGAILGR